MSLTPLLNTPLYIQLHIVAALLALTLGPVVLYSRKRSPWHKRLGYVWITAMLVVALSALFIPDFSGTRHFGLLHLFVPLTLHTLFTAVRHARAGRIAAHAANLRGLYWYGLMIAGLFNFLPGRRVNRSLFGEPSEWGYVVIGLGLALLIWRGFGHRIVPLAFALRRT